MGLIDIARKTGITGDITKPCETMADMLQDGNVRVRHLVKLFFGDERLKRLQSIKLQEAQDDVDAQAIRAGKKRYVDGAVVDVSGQNVEFDAIQFVALKNQVEDTQRLALAVKETVEKLRKMPEAKGPVEEASTTFYNRWRKEVETIDDAQLRDIWTGILAQEISAPKSVSLRTMDVVRNLSLNDARVFQKVIKGQIEGCIPKDENGNVQYARFDEVLQMQESGLLQAADFAEITFSRTYTKEDGKKGVVLVLEASNYVICADEGLRLSCFPLTKAGIELSRLVFIERTEADVIEIAKSLDKKIKGKNISVHQKIYGLANEMSFKKMPVWTATPPSPAK